MKDVIYLDHAATTPVDPRVVEAMLPYFTDNFGNPSGVYSLSQRSQKGLEDARDTVAEVLGCKPTEVIFTSGATESDNAAIKGGALALRQSGNHIITTSIEHHAVLHACGFMEDLGYEVTRLPVDRYGMVDVDDLTAAINEKTVLVSIILANNEIGTIQPMSELAAAVKDRARSLERDIIVHTDATQAGGVLDLKVDRLGVDMLTLGAHKFYGPKGVGVLYLRKGTPFMSQQHGGSQERNRRAGTENIPLVVGCAESLRLAEEQRESYNAHCRKLRDRLIEGVPELIGNSCVNGHPTERLPNNANFCFDGVEGESVLVGLDLEGIAASSGSACTSGSVEPSHVLSAMGVPAERAVGSLRLTVGRSNDDEDIDKVLDVLPRLIERLRVVSGIAQATS